MSVVGFDIGNESCIVAVARQRGIDVILNELSKRETPAVVCFGDKQRFIGTAGAASSMKNPKNAISQIKRLVGRRFSDPELQHDIQTLPFTVMKGPDGFPLIQTRYLGKQRTFTPTQVLGMILSNLKGIAEKNLNAAVVDCCIGIPLYFTDLERRAVLDAATIAGLQPLRLFHETTATALAYGIYKTDLPENDHINVAFVDFGHASMQVCLAGFKKGQLKIFGHSYDRSLGGRDFDEVLFKHFAAKFKDEYKVDVYRNARSCLRLRAACEKLKKLLCANPEARLDIECLMDEKDVGGFIRRDEFEQISLPILERVKGPLKKALVAASLTVEDIHSVEVVGSGSRVPAIIRILTEFFGKEPRRTLNASECVAHGCALQCAILSPTFRVRDFQVHESIPFPIALSWKGYSLGSQNRITNNQQSSIIFPKGNPIPSVKVLTFNKASTFSVDVMYADANDLHVQRKISTYTIGPFQSTKGERAKLKVKVHLNLHGIVSVDSMLEEEEFEVPVSAAKMDIDETTNDSASAQGDVNMQDAKSTIVDSNVGAENGLTETEGKAAQMETGAMAEVFKKKVKKINVPVVELVYGAMVTADLQKAVQEEFEMAFQDRLMEETKDKKNAVEAYVYSMRNKVKDKYNDFVSATEREELSAKLQEVEYWLYRDGEDEKKGVYIAKLEELKKQGDPIEERYKEWTERGPAIEQLDYCINRFKEAVMSEDPKYDHIDVREKHKVITECMEAEAWLREKVQQQNPLPKYATPVLCAVDVKRKAEALYRFCSPVMTKPRLEARTPQPDAVAQQPQGGDETDKQESAKDLSVQQGARGVGEGAGAAGEAGGDQPNQQAQVVPPGQPQGEVTPPPPQQPKPRGGAGHSVQASGLTPAPRLQTVHRPHFETGLSSAGPLPTSLLPDSIQTLRSLVQEVSMLVSAETARWRDEAEYHERVEQLLAAQSSEGQRRQDEVLTEVRAISREQSALRELLMSHGVSTRANFRDIQLKLASLDDRVTLVTEQQLELQRTLTIEDPAEAGPSAPTAPAPTTDRAIQQQTART